MQIGVDTFVATAKTGPTGDAQRVQELLEEVELAEQVGLDVFGIGEHHRREYLDSAAPMMAPELLRIGTARRRTKTR